MNANDPGQPVPDSGRRIDGRDLAVPRSVLAVGAHPDDVEFGCGATLAKWGASGCTIHHLVCTDGSKGTWDPEADVGRLVARRQLEQREAAARLAGAAGHGDVEFLGYVDGELENQPEGRRRVVSAIRRLRPDVILTHDPWKRYRLHPDHRHAGYLVCDAVVEARDPHFLPDLGLPPHRPSALMLWEADEPNHAEDVEGFVAVKIEALEAHESQFESTMGATDAASLEAFRRSVHDRAAELGALAGMGAAELFRLIDDL